MGRYSLRFRYYRDFFLLIVVPMLAVLAVALFVLRNMFVNQATEKVEQYQNQLTSQLEAEVSDSSLRLAHLALVNGNESLYLASNMNRADSVSRYEYTLSLLETLNTTIVPRNNVVAVHYFFKDGSSFVYKEALQMDTGSIRQDQAYRQALDAPGVTVVGPIFRANAYGSRNTYIIGIYYAPGWIGSQNQVEMVCFYLKTETPKLIKSFSQGQMLVIGADGRIMLDSGQGLEGRNISEIPVLRGTTLGTAASFVRKIGGRQTNVIVRPVQNTDWYVISLVDYAVLLRDFYQVFVTLLLVIAVFFLLYTVYSVLFLRDMIRPISNLTAAMKKVEKGDLSAFVKPSGAEELVALSGSFNHMVQQIDGLIAEGQRKEQEKARMELNALQSQINPHFLSNALNSIRFIAMISKFESVQKMVEALIKILTASFNRSGSDSTVGEEREVLDSYVYLMKIRYSDRFEMSYDIPEELESYCMPKLTLQPIVENAIVHGLDDEEEETTEHIAVGARLENGDLYVTVEDDGVGMTRERINEVLNLRKDKASVGLANVGGRIKLNYGASYGVSIDSEPGKFTRVTVRLPARKLPGEE